MVIISEKSLEKKPGSVAVSALAGDTATAPVGVYRRSDVEGAGKPPACNTGAFATWGGAEGSSEKVPGVLVDWLRVTFPSHADALEWAKVLFGPGLDWQEMGFGRYFYRRCLRRGDVSIYYGGDKCAGTVMVEASGKGCRQLESEGVLEKPSPEFGLKGGWRGLIDTLREYGCTFPRIDWAFDDTEGRIDLAQVQETMRAGDCATRFRKWGLRQEHSAKDGSVAGETLYFGSRTSLMWVRMYDKRLERLERIQRERNKERQAEMEAGLPASWVRVEVEAHDELADVLARRFAEEGAVAVASALRHWLDFKEAAGDSNKCRRPTVGWWGDFLAWAEKQAAGLAPVVRTMAEAVYHLERMCAPLLALAMKSPLYGRRWLRGVLHDGMRRWRPRHIDMLGANLTQARKVRCELPMLRLSQEGLSDLRREELHRERLRGGLAVG